MCSETQMQPCPHSAVWAADEQEQKYEDTTCSNVPWSDAENFPLQVVMTTFASLHICLCTDIWSTVASNASSVWAAGSYKDTDRHYLMTITTEQSAALLLHQLDCRLLPLSQYICNILLRLRRCFVNSSAAFQSQSHLHLQIRLKKQLLPFSA